MKITWLGHDAFLFETSDGVKILSDPYESGSYNGAVGYKPIDEVVDVVFCTHEHADHGAHAQLPGNPHVILGGGTHEDRGIAFKGINTFHDKTQGSERGENTVFVFNIEGLTICHLGDLGHSLTAQHKEQIGTIDLLFVPIGGVYTIDHEEAWEVVQFLSPKIAVPIHYKTDVLNFPLTDVNTFLRGKSNVQKINASEFEISTDTLPKILKIVVFKEHKL